MHAGVQCPDDHSFRNTWPRLTEPIPFLGGFFDGSSLRSRNRFSKLVTSVVMVTSFAAYLREGPIRDPHRSTFDTTDSPCSALGGMCTEPQS